MKVHAKKYIYAHAYYIKVSPVTHQHHMILYNRDIYFQIPHGYKLQILGHSTTLRKKSLMQPVSPIVGCNAH